MRLGQLFSSVTAWQKLSAIPLKPSVAYKLLKYTRFVSAEHEIAEKQRVALIHEITGTAAGQDAKIEPGSEEFVEYAEKFNEIMATEIKFEQIKLNLEDVVELLDDKPDALSVSDLALLEPFFWDYPRDGEEVVREEYADVLAKIKRVAASEFGREVEIFVDDGKECGQCKPVKDLPDCCWQLKQIDYSQSIKGPEGKLPFYRLDVQRGNINSHAILNPRKDITEEEIKRKFTAMNVAYEEFCDNPIPTAAGETS